VEEILRHPSFMVKADFTDSVEENFFTDSVEENFDLLLLENESTII